MVITSLVSPGRSLSYQPRGIAADFRRSADILGACYIKKKHVGRVDRRPGRNVPVRVRQRVVHVRVRQAVVADAVVQVAEKQKRNCPHVAPNNPYLSEFANYP